MAEQLDGEKLFNDPEAFRKKWESKSESERKADVALFVKVFLDTDDDWRNMFANVKDDALFVFYMMRLTKKFTVVSMALFPPSLPDKQQDSKNN